uniref:Lymphocyte antigen 75 n=1 Tax=Sphenodon punctatus TaxID=8508 RepID=A0A8D0HCU8_SPHPU
MCLYLLSADNDVFTIRHEKTNKCLQVKNSRIVAADCKETEQALWTWVSQHRLFHVGSQQCLGVNIARFQYPLKMVNCDSDLILWWQCEGASIVSGSQFKLTLRNLSVTASINSSDTLRRGNSSSIICEHPYQEIYTRDGNSYGKPCEFPFLINKTWHHDCIQDETHTGSKWCATTVNYNQDGKWGFCLKSEDGCQNTWDHDEGSENCYQFNTQAALTWKEAYLSCQRQGGDLLSIRNSFELNYIKGKDGVAETFWIGLNQLDTSGGWQWSDHTPLNFLSWNTDMQSSSPLDGLSCVAMNANSGQWESSPCETALPYVCKKQFGDKSEFTETQCDSGWLPHNGFCYLLTRSSAGWDSAHQLCKANNSDLISIHSLADVELVVSQLHNDEIWTGFTNEDTPALFKWSDGSNVVFTYWDQNEPKIPFNSTPNCVSYSGELGRWRVKSCSEKLKYVCMKKGEVNETHPATYCSAAQAWRHGDFCYKIYKNLVPFGAQCNLTIRNRFEQEFINRLIRKDSNIKDGYVWTGLQDINSSGGYTWGSTDGRTEAVMYSNWNAFQPDLAGGCVAMSSGKSLGKWEVKNCKTFKAYSICKNYIGPPRQPEVLPKPTDPCPPGWHNGSGLACYKFFHKERILRTRTWEEAERFCEALGGHLPSFSNPAEMKELHSILRDIISNDRWIWTGLNKRNPDYLGSWQWSDDKPVSTLVMTHDFQEDDYDTRDCAALKTIRITRRPFWRLYFYDDRDLDFYLKPFHCEARLEWVCQITKGSTPKIPEWYTPDGDGIHGSPLVIDGSEFWFVSDKHLNYQEAADYCLNSGNDLASVTSFTALRGFLNRITNVIQYLSSLVPFIVKMLLWQGSKQCDYYPITVNCHLKLPFVCEKYNITLLEKHDPEYVPPQGGCPKNWLAFQNKCFLQLKPVILTFKKANELCNTHGGTLPSIMNQDEQDFITSLLPDMPENIWLGLRFLPNTRDKKWVDDSELQYSNFHPLLLGRLRRIPYHDFDEEVYNQCGVLLNNPKTVYIGTWNVTSCADAHFVSLYMGTPVNQTQQVINETVNYQNVRYTILLKNLTWYEAMKECLENNMQLVSITEQYQQAFLTAKVAQRHQPMWIGLSSKDGGTHYSWSDGRHVSVSRWSEDDEDLNEECVVLDITGSWKTADCYTKKPGVICYLPEKESEKVQVISPIQCPYKIKNTPWIAFQNSCYTFLVVKDRWKDIRSQEAHHLCRKMNQDAFVLNIRDENENNFVTEQLQAFSGLATWVSLGVVYDASDNLLKWYDETHLAYNKWRLGRPIINSNPIFAGVNQDGFWDIYNYTYKWSFQFNLHSVLACKIEMGHREHMLPLPKTLQHRNRTYWILQKKLTWYQALRECKQNGGDLASINEELEQIFLEDVVKRDGFPLWLGLSNHDGNKSNFEWSDGGAFDYIPWEFENVQSSGNCIVLNITGFWIRKNCADAMDGAICYTSSDRRQSKQTKSSRRCPQNIGKSQWIEYKDHCYAFDMALYNFSVYTAEEAKGVCQKLDPSATLLTIQDAEENTFVSTHLRENDCITRRVWLGLSQESRKDIYTGKKCYFSFSFTVSNHTGVAIAFALLIIVVLVTGLMWYLYKKNQLHWGRFSSVRYERGINAEECDTMFTKDGD